MNVRILLFRPVLILMLCAAGVLSRAASTPISDWGTKDRVWAYIGEVTGDSKEACVAEICRQAVHVATGRFYFGEEMFLARELLTKYLDSYAEQFIVSKDIISVHQAGELFSVRVRVNVLTDQLFNDLKIKHFVYKPKSFPFFYVFLSETMDGKKAAQPLGRQTIEGMIDAKGLARNKTPLLAPPIDADVLAKADVLDEARRQAQKANVELLIVGSLATEKVDEKTLYYKNQTYYESRIELALIRVDDGKPLETARSTVRITRAKAEEASNESIKLAAQDVAAKLLEFYSQNWAKTIHETAGWRLMITGASEDEGMSVGDRLKALHPSIKIYPRNFFGKVTVLNFEYEGDPKMLLLFLKREAMSHYRLIVHNDNRFELEALRR
ncbi:MAG: hypothetical protein NTX50_31710 [Candidatus Sumerlaeota bacterium]|nr:hypothetical protein [Candidatus Sumerlaeota bacterium]